MDFQVMFELESRFFTNGGEIRDIVHTLRVHVFVFKVISIMVGKVQIKYTFCLNILSPPGSPSLLKVMTACTTLHNILIPSPSEC